MATVREETYNLLRTLGMTTVFGNPGSTEEPFLKEFPADFDYVLALQEASAVSMADGYAQAARKPALVNLHTSVGMGNGMGGIVGAFHNKTPLVITVGQQTRQMAILEPLLFNREAVTLPRPYVKWSYEPMRAQDVPAALARAYYLALQPPAGPVFVSIPMDDWDETCEPYPARVVSHRMSPDAGAIVRAAETLNGAAKPALVAGAGVDRSLGGWDALVALAEHTQSAVYAAPMSERAGFPEDHALFQGFLPFAQAPLADKLAGHDVVLVLGAPVFRYYPHVPGQVVKEGTRLIQITDDADEAARAPYGDSIVGDVALAIEQITALITDKGRTPPPRMPAMPPEPPQTPIPTAYLMEQLGQALPADTVIVEESYSNLVQFHKQFHVRRSGSYFTNAAGGLGWAMPASVGIKMAHPDRPVVCVIGDGSSMYSVQALWTASQRKLPVVFVVVSNSEYNILKSFAAFEHAERVPGLDLPNLDIAPLAQGFGCDTKRIEKPEDIKPAVQSALQSSRPTVLNVIVDAATPPLIPK